MNKEKVDKENLLSVITVNFNDKNGLKKTLDSLLAQNRNLEIVVIDGGSTDGSLDVIKEYSSSLAFWVSEKDNGIYDAMNKGLDRISGKYHVFINSGDYLVGQVFPDTINEPCFIPVKFIDFKGKDRYVSIRNIKQGIPFCHQGMIFMSSEIRYDPQFSLAGDYIYYLEHSQKKYFPYSETEGYVVYDNTGASAQNFDTRDREVGLVIKKEFGAWQYFIFRCKSTVKSFIKNILRKFI